MSILVTGGTGLVGSNVARLLIEQGREVVLHDRVPLSEGNVLGDLAKRTKLILGNVADLAHMLHVIKDNKVKGIVHCASMVSQAANEHPIEALQVNIIGSANMLEAARIMDLGRVVVITSSGVMGVHQDLFTPLREEEVQLPLGGIYANCKLAIEQIVHTYRQIYKVDAIAIRPRNIYGPGERRHGHPVPTYDVVMAALAGRPIVLATGGDSYFDLTYVRDLARGIILGYDCKAPTYYVYNVSAGANRSMAEVCAVLKGVFPKLRIEIGPGLWEGVIATGAQIDFTYRSSQKPALDISRARNDFGYVPEYPIERGIPAWIRWMQNQSYDGDLKVA